MTIMSPDGCCYRGDCTWFPGDSEQKGGCHDGGEPAHPPAEHPPAGEGLLWAGTPRQGGEYEYATTTPSHGGSSYGLNPICACPR